METQEIPPPYNVAAPAFARINELEAKVTELQAIIEDRDRVTTQLYNELSSLRATIDSDSAVISDHLIDSADRHGFCEAYDELIRKVNSQLRVIVLREREAEWEVDVRLEAQYTVYHKAYIKAVSQRAADSLVAGDPDAYIDADDVLRDAISNGEESDFSYEVTVVD